MNKKNILAVLGGLLGFIYILNPTAGFFELLPDNIPFIGNLDEAGAVLLILGCLRHFNIDLTGHFKNKENKENKENESNYPKK
jgi:hypothetical protein